MNPDSILQSVVGQNVNTVNFECCQCRQPIRDKKWEYLDGPQKRGNAGSDSVICFSCLKELLHQVLQLMKAYATRNPEVVDD